MGAVRRRIESIHHTHTERTVMESAELAYGAATTSARRANRQSNVCVWYYPSKG